MKKIMILIIGCSIWGTTFAQQTPGNNTTERAARKTQDKQSKKFQSDRKYASLTNSHQAKSLRKEQAKANGKAL